MARFGRDDQHFNLSSLTQISPIPESINLDLSSGPSSFMLFSNGTLLDESRRHQSYLPINLYDDMREKEKNEEGTSRKRKRVMKHREMDVQKPKDVVHVRAKRGQATDSHSLAERVRREKINERLRSLQDLVPGCYKTMGMAVMLDVIINYVRSLQNQIEFLSMKLSAASAYYGFNFLEFESMEILQGSNSYEQQEEMDRILRESHGAQAANFGSSWPF